MEESKWIGTFVDSLRKSCSGGRDLTGTGPGGVRRGGSMSDSVIQSMALTSAVFRFSSRLCWLWLLKLRNHSTPDTSVFLSVKEEKYYVAKTAD